MTGVFAELRSRLARWVRTAPRDRHGRHRIGARQIYILPTRYGVLLALILVLMLIGAVNYANNLAFLLTFLLASIALVTMVQTWRTLKGLELDEAGAGPVFAGEPARFQFDAFEPEGRERPGLRLSGNQTEAAADLAAFGVQRFELRSRTRRRGLHRLGRVRVQTRYPLGLFVAWSYLDPQLAGLVYPRPARRGQEPIPPEYGASDEGDRGVGADDFIGLRSYRAGDPPRRLDWKSLARGRGPLSKQFGGDRANQRIYDYDALDGLDPERRLAVLARLLIDAEARQQGFGLGLPGERIGLGHGPAHLHRCLAALARFEP